ncbi:MAG: DoxX family protein [Bacteroidetes bacterium]|jgi:uncharacterized membrane protein|nr:DoxX family protein [Bacteroidota bacterium]
MTGPQKSFSTAIRTMHISLWIAQVILALFLLMGAIMKFMPTEKISQLMPWTGEIPSVLVRALGVIDLLGALGLILPALLRIQPKLTTVASIGVIALMIAATVFHLSRGEASVIGMNIFCIALAAFIAWGRLKKAPTASK